MLLLKALRNRAVSRLWMGQVGSAIGDEVYRVAFIWLAVDLVGRNTGYLASLQVLAVLIFGVFGGKWADHWNPYRLMITVDLLRAGITLTPVVLFYLNQPSFATLVVSSILLAGLGAFFEPALQSVLPIAAKDVATLKATNGLMSTTIRLARVMGPALIGVLSTVVATIHFFSLNSLSYLWSAFCVSQVSKSAPQFSLAARPENLHVLSHFFESFRKTKSNPIVYRSLLAKCISGGAWMLVYGLGIALLIHEISPKDVKAFGMVMGAYGIGNISAALWFGNRERRHPERMVYLGLAWLSISFLLMACITQFWLFLLITAITAVGGPLNDLPFTDLVQREFSLADLPKIFRVRMIIENLCIFIFLILSPLLFKAFPVRHVIFGCGIFIGITSIYGFTKLSLESKTSITL